MVFCQFGGALVPLFFFAPPPLLTGHRGGILPNDVSPFTPPSKSPVFRFVPLCVVVLNPVATPTDPPCVADYPTSDLGGIDPSDPT